MFSAKRRRLILACVFALAANLLFFLTQWLATRYDRVSLEQILYQMQTSISGTSKKLTSSASIRVGIFGVSLTVIQAILYFLLSGSAKDKLKKWTNYIKYCSSNVCRFFAKRVLPLSATMLLCSILIFAVRLDVLAYVGNSMTESDFIEQHYVDPQQTELVFPEEKRNLIYIFLESMENTYTDTTACDTIEANYIPNLTQLAQDNVSFSHSTGMGGAQSLEGTTWTAAAMVAQTSGVTLKVTLDEEEYGSDDQYLPGVTTIGDILEEEGYRNVLLMGSKGIFANRNVYFENHGNYEMVELMHMRETGRLPAKYYEWWGFEDVKLFEFAKEELDRLSQSDEPFNLTMLTADTHFPDGYVCPLCENTYQQQYGNVMTCSDNQLAAFLAWVQEQPFYENTTIVLSGDHLTMDPAFLQNIDPNYVRTNYNCFINAAVVPVSTRNRQFGTIDMFPTTLAAMGVRIEGNCLGLGTDLFSGEETLAEKYGIRELDKELQKNSPYYETKFFGFAPKEETQQ